MTNKLTYKQKAFVNEFVKSKNATSSAMNVYHVKNRSVARQIGSENLAKPYIRQSIDMLLQASGYDPEASIKALIENEQVGAGVKATASDSIRASELLLKISSNFIEKQQTVSVSMNIDSMNKEELLKLKQKYDKLLREGY
ncbi:MAG: hypothetical protein UR89_C0029G0005 [Candidatus Roizmanbacteria bacterium GW2011_GWA2_35_8]|uniref:Terminase small subunit n=1 Tax=Candidatus Roizmanbacteria bacterium GW2011_GWA2_35_8 TaxID=1618479 RepID=A0A0G0FFJ2_9BACT|nr:MAG: hypothetical protein UR89_C0029G0005 [Candidatus Roizmanbacteria bacterium GW2011_GWA2_35_8]